MLRESWRAYKIMFCSLIKACNVFGLLPPIFVGSNGLTLPYQWCIPTRSYKIVKAKKIILENSYKGIEQYHWFCASIYPNPIW